MSALTQAFADALTSDPAAQAFGLSGAWAEGGVPAGTPHPFASLYEGDDIYDRNHQVEGPNQTPMIVTIEDATSDNVVSYARAENIGLATRQRFTRRPLSVPDRRVMKVVPESTRRRPPLYENNRNSVAVIVTFQVHWA